LVSLASHLAFWKKRDAEKPSEAARIIPLPNLSGSNLGREAEPATPVETVEHAREALKVLKLERQIIGSAVTTIYESHSKGVISEAERDRMLEKYKSDLKRVEKNIAENQEVVELHDLEAEREEVIKSFNTKLAEIDAKLRNLKSGTPPKPAKPTPLEGSGNSQAQDSANNASDSDPLPPSVSDSEKKIEEIREEILKAMDRLEQIETEG